MWGTFKKVSFVLLPAVLLLGSTSTPLSATDEQQALLYIPGIQENAEEPAEGEGIEILSCDWGSVPPPRGLMVSGNSKGPAGKLCFGDFSFLKHVDESSDMLAEYCSKGVELSHIRVEISGSNMGGFKYLVLRKVKVLSVRPGKTEGDGRKTEVVTVGFRQVEYQ